MVGLGIGAGLGATDLRSLRVSTSCATTMVTCGSTCPEAARAPHPRPRPVRAVRAARSGRARRPGPGARDEGDPAERHRQHRRHAAIGSTNVVPDQARLRATWILTAMTAPIPLADLLAAAGISSARTLTDLIPYAHDVAYVETLGTASGDVHAQRRREGRVHRSQGQAAATLTGSRQQDQVGAGTGLTMEIFLVGALLSALEGDGMVLTNLYNVLTVEMPFDWQVRLGIRDKITRLRASPRTRSTASPSSLRDHLEYGTTAPPSSTHAERERPTRRRCRPDRRHARRHVAPTSRLPVHRRDRCLVLGSRPRGPASRHSRRKPLNSRHWTHRRRRGDARRHRSHEERRPPDRRRPSGLPPRARLPPTLPPTPMGPTRTTMTTR